MDSDSAFDFYRGLLSLEQRFVRVERENSESLDANFQFAMLTRVLPPMWVFRPFDIPFVPSGKEFAL